METAKFVFLTICLLCFAEVFCSRGNYGEVGSDITLTPGISKNPEEIVWKHNGDKVVEYDGSEVTMYGTFEGRVDINFENGQLTIRKLSGQDSGEYQSDIVIDGKVQTVSRTLKVLDAFPEPRVTCEWDETSDRNKLVCSVDSQTWLTYMWTGPNLKDHAGPELFTDGLDKDLAYTCTVKSDARNRSTRFNLQGCGSGGAMSGVHVGIIIGLIMLLLLCLGVGLGCFFYRQKKAKCEHLLNSDPTEVAPAAARTAGYHSVPDNESKEERKKKEGGDQPKKGHVAKQTACFEEIAKNEKGEQSPQHPNEGLKNLQAEERRKNKDKQTTVEKDHEETDQSDTVMGVNTESEGLLNQKKSTKTIKGDQKTAHLVSNADKLGSGEKKEEGKTDQTNTRYSDATLPSPGRLTAPNESSADGERDEGETKEGKTPLKETQQNPQSEDMRNGSEGELEQRNTEEEDQQITGLIGVFGKMKINETGESPHQQNEGLENLNTEETSKSKDKQTTEEEHCKGTDLSNTAMAVMGENKGNTENEGQLDQKEISQTEIGDQKTGDLVNDKGSGEKKGKEKIDRTKTGLSDATHPSPATKEGQKPLMETKQSPQSAETGNGSEGELQSNYDNSQNAVKADENTNSKPDETDTEEKSHGLLQSQEQMEIKESQTSPEQKHEQKEEQKTDSEDDDGNKEEEGDEQRNTGEEDQQIVGQNFAGLTAQSHPSSEKMKENENNEEKQKPDEDNETGEKSPQKQNEDLENLKREETGKNKDEETIEEKDQEGTDGSNTGSPKMNKALTEQEGVTAQTQQSGDKQDKEEKENENGENPPQQQNEGLENLKPEDTSKDKDEQTAKEKDHEGKDGSNTGSPEMNKALTEQEGVTAQTHQSGDKQDKEEKKNENGENSQQQRNEGLENQKHEDTSKNKDKQTTEENDHNGTDPSNTETAVTDEKKVDTQNKKQLDQNGSSQNPNGDQKTEDQVKNEDKLRSGMKKEEGNMDQTNTAKMHIMDSPDNPVTDAIISSDSSSDQTDPNDQTEQESDVYSDATNEEQKPTQEKNNALKGDQKGGQISEENPTGDPLISKNNINKQTDLDGPIKAASEQ